MCKSIGHCMNFACQSMVMYSWALLMGACTPALRCADRPLYADLRKRFCKMWKLFKVLMQFFVLAVYGLEMFVC